MRRATTACPFLTSERQKVVCTCGALYILTWKRASRHNGVRFFDLSTSKSGPRPSGFYTFDLEACFAPQQRALFRHLNVKKWSVHAGLALEMCFAPHGAHFLDIATSRLAKAVGAEPCGQMRHEKLHAVLWREAHFQFKTHKAHHGRTTFGS